MILTVLTISCKGDTVTFPEFVTYVILPALLGLGGLIKSGFPRWLAAKLRGDESTRKHQQKIDELSQAFYHSEREVTNQAMASVVAAAQEEERKANDFVRTTVFNTLDKIKTDTVHVPGLITEVRESGKETNKRITGLETRQRMLINLITGGKLADEDEPTDDYEAWRKRKLDENPQPRISQNRAEGDNGE